MAFFFNERTFMKFYRKLIKRSGLYGSITIPSEVLSAWTEVDQVEMNFDGMNLVITPAED